MAKSYTHEHRVYVYELNRHAVSDSLADSLEESENLWHVFNADYYIGYLVKYDIDTKTATTHGVANEVKAQIDNETEAVTCVAQILFPEATIITDKEEVKKFALDNNKDDLVK